MENALIEPQICASFTMALFSVMFHVSKDTANPLSHQVLASL